MDLPAILFVIALLLLGGAHIVQPLFRPHAVRSDQSIDVLQADYLETLRQIQSMEPAAEGEPQHTSKERTRLLARGADLLRQIDTLTVQDMAEKAVRQRRVELNTASVVSVCPECAAHVDPAHQFCPACGVRLERGQE